MRSVIETLDGSVPSMFGRRAMRWMPPEDAVMFRARRDEAEAAAREMALAAGKVLQPAEVDA